VTYSEPLVNFIKSWEGLKYIASGDPLVKGVRDVGYGHVLMPGEDIPYVTDHEADELLRTDLQEVVEGVERLLTVKVSQCQFDALCSFAYNLGLGALGRSTLLRCLNGGLVDAACSQFTLWCHAGGREVEGLLKRRVAEQAVFHDGDYSGRP